MILNSNKFLRTLRFQKLCGWKKVLTDPLALFVGKPPYRFSKVVFWGIFLLIRLGLELGLRLGVRVGVGFVT
jgi:hypothetical protein